MNQEYELIKEYANVVKVYGPDSPKSEAFRMANSQDKKFLKRAKVINQIAGLPDIDKQ